MFPATKNLRSNIEVNSYQIFCVSSYKPILPKDTYLHSRHNFHNDPFSLQTLRRGHSLQSLKILRSLVPNNNLNSWIYVIYLALLHLSGKWYRDANLDRSLRTESYLIDGLTD